MDTQEFRQKESAGTRIVGVPGAYASVPALARRHTY